jgi:hypothetical protein
MMSSVTFVFTGCKDERERERERERGENDEDERSRAVVVWVRRDRREREGDRSDKGLRPENEQRCKERKGTLGFLGI